MNQNIFEELQIKKQSLTTIAQKATTFGWITPEREREIIEKINNDVLTIGVIGQMKCGKSTFLNSFVFEDDVLPAATTPMTAALSVITYGEEKKVVAEFYDKDEWEEQKLMASRSLDEVQGNSLEESKIKAAKELVERAVKLGPSITTYLGKTQEDRFENLIEYVGAEGNFISITKSVTIYYPKEYLKGVEIVDTPGFNDPIVSREERTKAFLKRADVVLMMLYAGRPFDATDRDILFKNVRQCGTGKVIIGINKYDIPYENGEGIDEIKNYVREEIRKACKACDDNTLVEIIRQTDPIPLSAEMALLSKFPMNKITGNEAYKHAWERSCNIFEISSQSQLLENSHLNNLTSAVKQMIETEKGTILFAKPLNTILAAGNSKKAETEKEIRENEGMIENLNMPNDELEEKLYQTTKVSKKVARKIDSLGGELDGVFYDIIRKGGCELEDEVEKACKQMKQVVDDWGVFESVEKIVPKLNEVQGRLVTKTLKRKVDELSVTAKEKIKKTVKDFFAEIEDVLFKLPDFDGESLMRKLSENIQLEINEEELFSFDDSDDSDYNWGNLLWDFLNGASWGLMGAGGNLLSHGEIANDLHKNITALANEFNPKPYLETINQHKKDIIANIKKALLDELITPMQEQIEGILSQTGEKEAKLKTAKSNLIELKEKKNLLNKQQEEITQLHSSLN